MAEPHVSLDSEASTCPKWTEGAREGFLACVYYHMLFHLGGSTENLSTERTGFARGDIQSSLK